MAEYPAGIVTSIGFEKTFPGVSSSFLSSSNLRLYSLGRNFLSPGPISVRLRAVGAGAEVASPGPSMAYPFRQF